MTFLQCNAWYFTHIKLMIGASLSEPHTRELGGEISVHMYACLLACIRRTSRAN